ncbi:hypothetical protein B0T17DRAFT_512200 [Bombardia bombarda]|uniref:Uncharacterized protein n=1 Tax=Bombardia bombarda TaxID=252184 RepID=A0AA39U4E6_9PEZI|nr:hypothetical protein B0T17DRAFT_512200 [Bombardia bombarda]
MGRVPTISQVIPGAHVDIVLKADQRTGRTVSGAVGDVLTRGNHPRGIKVRLQDGRVGRVQAMSSAGSTVAVTETARPGDGFFFDLGPRAPRPDDPDLPPPPQVGLDAYLKPPRPQKNAGKRKAARGESHATAFSSTTAPADNHQEATPPEASPDTATCPICSDFHGDATAVSHHVATHFGE